MSKEKVILAYSGGLDTSVAITWLMKDYDVVAVCMDVGEGKDLDFIHDKALKVGAPARENGRDDRNHDVGQLGEVGQAIDKALRSTRPAVGGARKEALLDVARCSVAIEGRNDEGGGDARPGEGGNHPVGGPPATAQFTYEN